MSAAANDCVAMRKKLRRRPITAGERGGARVGDPVRADCGPIGALDASAASKTDGIVARSSAARSPGYELAVGGGSPLPAHRTPRAARERTHPPNATTGASSGTLYALRMSLTLFA